MNAFRLVAAAIALAALLGLQNGGARAAQTTSQARSLVVDGLKRDYLFYRPPSLRAGAHPPLVVVMHGYSGRASGVELKYHWDDEADAGGFLVAYPDGIERGWNSGNCCGAAFERKIDDVKFLTTLVTTLEKDEGADPKRIYFTGMSNGALMSYRMACEASFPIAAIGPVAGNLDFACPSPQRTSVLAINGRADPMVPYVGGKDAPPSRAPAVQSWRVNLPPVAATFARWRSVDACGAVKTSTAGPVTTEVAECPAGLTVELISIDGAGHQWPGADPSDPAVVAALAQQGLIVDPPSTALSATHTLWQFFATKVSR